MICPSRSNVSYAATGIGRRLSHAVGRRRKLNAEVVVSPSDIPLCRASRVFGPFLSRPNSGTVLFMCIPYHAAYKIFDQQRYEIESHQGLEVRALKKNGAAGVRQKLPHHAPPSLWLPTSVTASSSTKQETPWTMTSTQPFPDHWISAFSRVPPFPN